MSKVTWKNNRNVVSPGVWNVTRPVPSLAKDYHTEVGEMETKDLFRSTLTDETHITYSPFTFSNLSPLNLVSFYL